jgi:hypothetical protein
MIRWSVRRSAVSDLITNARVQITVLMSLGSSYYRPGTGSNTNMRYI